MQIDELLSKLDAKDAEIARQVDEKEQELMIMQEGMDSTLRELGELRLVSPGSILDRSGSRRG